ncbi:succinate dehydrogenase assembly factor 2 [Neisseria sp. Ec49-e6-T10]|uniref:succinate dehydrogenase assembly factor 2 n=1 Tax=Neisseria sp. Ec49-e6-T10 TaxID=3140744 RepID=UPI003EBB05B4
MSKFDEVERKRIRWRTRRGLLELDLILQKFLDQDFDQLNDHDMTIYCQILDLPDTEFLDIVNGKAEPQNPEWVPLINRLRSI